jgi:hypothetical protein
LAERLHRLVGRKPRAVGGDLEQDAVRFARLKISGDEIVRTPASADVDPGSSGAYPIAIGIERVQKPRFIGTGIWLNAPQRAFVYEKRCLYRAIVSPKSHGMPRSVI